MFEAKQKSLISKSSLKAPLGAASVKSATQTNPFILHGQGKQVQTRSGNGSLKLSTSGNDFVDQFSTVAQYRTPRNYKEVATDMMKLWSKNPLAALMFTFYLRMITRVVSFFDGTKTSTTQRGQGMKNEGIFRYIWIAVNYPDTFWKNITTFISIGSWKDVITMLSYDLQWNGWHNRALDWEKFGHLILAGLENPNQSELIKKYLPQIKANNACKTLESQADNIIAKWICSLLYGGKTQEDNYKHYRSYRKLKSSGTAHEWQQLISRKQLLQIDFDSIHGRALSQLVSSKFLKNNGLADRYSKWIANKPVAKFTGFVHELVEKINTANETYQIQTINAQFNKLVEVAKEGLALKGLRPISVIDCSGSMSYPMYLGGGKVGKLRSIEVAVSSMLFFDEMIMSDSPFKNHFLSFASKTLMHDITGSNFVERYKRTIRSGGASTNFMSVFEFFADFKRNNPTISEELIPNFIVVFSDGEFDGVRTGLETNVQAGRRTLKAAGFSQEYCDSFGICFVDLPNTFYSYKRQPKFETFANAKNCFYFSGYDLSPLAFLFGTTNSNKIPQTAEELFDAAMDQESLEILEV